MAQPLSKFEKLANFRDVAVSVNNRCGDTRLYPGKLYRSARPDQATLSDRTLLIQHYGIKTIIDLRTTTELLNATNASTSASKLEHETPATLSQANEIVARPLRIDGAAYANINISGKGFERFLLWQLTFWSLAKVVLLMLLGYRMNAVSILGREVLKPRGLTGLAIDTIDHSQPEIRQLFSRLGDESSWPVMIHCTQGKDRSGLAIILILLLCSVDIETITHDYVLSETELAEEFEERMQEISSIGLDDSFARCPPDLPSRVEQHIIQRHGSINQYLDAIGVTEQECRTVQTQLLSRSR